jgi:phosphoribosylamine---glycine ligase
MEKKNFLFVSKVALINDIAWQVMKEGHAAKYYIESESDRDVADGFVPKVADWRKEVDWADVVIFDDVGFGREVLELKARGKKVIGGTPYTDELEDNRSFGQEELKKAGVSIIPYKHFYNFDDAIAYVKERPDEYVIKPSGEAQNIKRLLFVGMEKDGSDVIRVLEAYKKVWSAEIKEFQLQCKVTGVEIAIGAFFNGRQFIYPINVNFEHKKMFPGNIGPATGEMGTSMFWSEEPNRLFVETLRKMEKKLAAENYIGYIDINCIVSGRAIYPLEFTARFGYPTISIQQDSMITPISEFLDDLASGREVKLKVKKGFAVGVRILVPPYPYEDEKTFNSYSKDATIVFKKNNLEGIHISETKMVNGQWLVAGTHGLAVVVAGGGTTMRQAIEQAYGRINNILIPNMYYRRDIGERWFEEFDRLYSWGVI